MYKLIGLTQDEIKLFDKNNIINDDINSKTDEKISDTESNKIINVTKKKISKSKKNIKDDNNTMVNINDDIEIPIKNKVIKNNT